MTSSSADALVLAGDIGGTKTNLGLFLQGEKRPVPKVLETYASKEAPRLEDIIQRFVEKHPLPVFKACFGIAGPVIDAKSKTTNLPWSVSADRIRKQFHFQSTRLINDLTATALAIPLLSADECFPLNSAVSEKDQNIALVAPGTGLGQALLVFDRDRYVPVPSEGGHADFAPANETQAELWQYLYQRYGHVSIERVLCGPGLVNIYTWLQASGRFQESEWLKHKLKEIDPARAITEGALEQNDALCQAALNLFVSIFGAVAGNLALTGMTTGGVYLGGGIPPKILSKLKQNTFMQAFADKGRFKNLLESIPVRVILNDSAALLGAAHCAFQM
jgi:glucokinase